LKIFCGELKRGFCCDRRGMEVWNFRKLDKKRRLRLSEGGKNAADFMKVKIRL
jgi:hypothetical protein